MTLWLHGPRWRDGRREGAALVVRRDHTHVQWDGGRVLRGGTCVDHGAVPLVMVWPRYSIVISWCTGNGVMVDLRISHDGSRQTLVREWVDVVGRGRRDRLGGMERIGDRVGRIGRGGRCSV